MVVVCGDYPSPRWQQGPEWGPANRSDPGTRLGGIGLERVDRGGLFHCQTNVIKTVEQAVLAEGIDFKSDDFAIGRGDGLTLEKAASIDTFEANAAQLRPWV